MKTFTLQLITLSVFFLVAYDGHSQILKTIGDKAKQKVGQRANNKVDKAMDKTLDEVEEGAKTKKDEDGDEKVKEADGTKIKTDADGTVKVKNEGLNEKSQQMAFTSKYDFVPGEKLVAFEDFSNAAIGDFPTRWNTNATAEVVSLNNRDGKWLKISKEGIFHPEFITNLPENFTLEFDLAVNPGWQEGHIAINIVKLDKPQDFSHFYHNANWKTSHGLHMDLNPGDAGHTLAYSRIITGSTAGTTLDNDVRFKVWDDDANNFAHVSMWRQAQRLRVYVNGEKIWDLPRAFDATAKYNAITIAFAGSRIPADYWLLGNLRLAVGAADTRNKLMAEGKFVTRGILFDVNSDKIKPESAGALKDIANVLKENAGLKVKIVGHTDADGDDKANLALSEKRAAAVKAHLTKEYGISGDNLTTEGKGESQLIDKSATPEGKANNRRVEFIKL